MRFDMAASLTLAAIVTVVVFLALSEARRGTAFPPIPHRAEPMR